MNIDFPKWLKHQREQRGWSPAELARRASVSRAAISNYEAGKTTNYDPKTLQKIARAFKIPAEQIYQAAHLLSSESKSDSDLWTKEMQHKISRIKAPASRRAVESVVNGLLGDEEQEDNS